MFFIPITITEIAASTFFPSGFKESAIVCLDNSGDNKSGAIFYGKNPGEQQIVIGGLKSGKINRLHQSQL